MDVLLLYRIAICSLADAHRSVFAEAHLIPILVIHLGDVQLVSRRLSLPLAT